MTKGAPPEQDRRHHESLERHRSRRNNCNPTGLATRHSANHKRLERARVEDPQESPDRGVPKGIQTRVAS